MRSQATSRPFRDLGLSLTLLTVVPLRTRWPEAERPDIAGYFPAAGLLLGGFAFLLAYAPVVHDVPFSSESPLHALLLAAVLITVWALLTRMFHWDALADVVDAYWGADEPDRRRSIMSDPHVGAFGACGLVLAVLLQLTAVAVLIGQGALLALAMAPVLGRYAAVFGAWLGTPAKPTGLGAAVAGRPRGASVLFAAALFAAVALAAGRVGPGELMVVIAGLLLSLATPHLLAARFGGVTGDVLGAAVLLTETAVLVLFAWVS